MWDEILWLRQCVTVSQSSCSCILQTRFKMLLAISQMQVRVGLGKEQALFWRHCGPGSLGSSMQMCGTQETPGSASPAHGSVSDRTGCPCLVLPGRTPVMG